MLVMHPSSQINDPIIISYSPKFGEMCVSMSKLLRTSRHAQRSLCLDQLALAPQVCTNCKLQIASRPWPHASWADEVGLAENSLVPMQSPAWNGYHGKLRKPLCTNTPRLPWNIVGDLHAPLRALMQPLNMIFTHCLAALLDQARLELLE